MVTRTKNLKYRDIRLKSTKLRTISKVLFVLAILSFIIIFALKMENNQEMKQYYSEKEEKAKQELAVLKEAHGQGGVDEQKYPFGFEITDDTIEVMNQVTPYVDTIGNFADFCTNNFESYVSQCYEIFEQFITDNENTIKKMEAIMLLGE
jgi:hypothetical protein